MWCYRLCIIICLININISRSIRPYVSRSQLGDDYSYRALFRWLETHQSRRVKRTGYDRVILGQGTGLGSMLHFSALHFAEIVYRGKVVQFKGHYKEFTRNSVCNHLYGSTDGSRCFFLPISEQKVQFNQAYGGHQLARGNFSMFIDRVRVPIALPQVIDPWLWWGVVQSFMFRLNDRTESIFSAVNSQMHFNSADIGVHWSVQHGSALRYLSMTDIVSSIIHEIEQAVETISKRDKTIYLSTDSSDLKSALHSWQRHYPNVRVLCRNDTAIKTIAFVGYESLFPVGALHYLRALEVLYDMHTLRHSTIFIGSVFSHVSKTAVSMGCADGSMNFAIGIDFNATLKKSYGPCWRHHVST